MLCAFSSYLLHGDLCLVIHLDAPRQGVAAPDEVIDVLSAIHLPEVGEFKSPITHLFGESQAAAISSNLSRILRNERR